MEKSAEMAMKILEELGTIRTPTGGVKVVEPNRQLLRVWDMMNIKKYGTFSVFDPTVVEKARKLARENLYVVHTGLEYELYCSFRRVSRK